MRITTNGAKEQLISRIQCMRDVVSVIDGKVDELIEARAICCGESPEILFADNRLMEFSDGENIEFS